VTSARQGAVTGAVCCDARTTYSSSVSWMKARVISSMGVPASAGRTTPRAGVCQLSRFAAGAAGRVERRAPAPRGLRQNASTSEWRGSSTSFSLCCSCSHPPLGESGGRAPRPRWSNSRRCCLGGRRGERARSGAARRSAAAGWRAHSRRLGTGGGTVKLTAGGAGATNFGLPSKKSVGRFLTDRRARLRARARLRSRAQLSAPRLRYTRPQ
jgi:hypothetical protein